MLSITPDSETYTSERNTPELLAYSQVLQLCSKRVDVSGPVPLANMSKMSGAVRKVKSHWRGEVLPSLGDHHKYYACLSAAFRGQMNGFSDDQVQFYGDLALLHNIWERENRAAKSVQGRSEIKLRSTLHENPMSAGLPWPTFLEDHRAAKLDGSESIAVLVDFSGNQGEITGNAGFGFLLNLERLEPPREPRQRLARRAEELRTRRQRCGSGPILGLGDHLVIMRNGKISLARRTQRAPRSAEIWILYPDDVVWRPKHRRQVWLPYGFETSLSSDPELTVIPAEAVDRHDQSVEVLYIAQNAP